MTDVIPFEFEASAVRVVQIDGAPWFVLKDVCDVLGHSNSRVAAKRLDEDERRDVNISDATHRLQKTTVTNESGLYSLTLTSRKPEAKRFKKWITRDVIPSIRRTGGYGQQAIDFNNPDHLLPLLNQYVAAAEPVCCRQQEEG